MIYLFCFFSQISYLYCYVQIFLRQKWKCTPLYQQLFCLQDQLIDCSHQSWSVCAFCHCCKQRYVYSGSLFLPRFSITFVNLRGKLNFSGLSFRACVRNLDLQVQSVLQKRALGPKIRRCQSYLELQNPQVRKVMSQRRQRSTGSFIRCTRANAFPVFANLLSFDSS